MLHLNKDKKFSFQLIFIMLLYLIIAILSVMIIISGQNAYISINKHKENNFERRIPISYIANKIRQSDMKNMIRLEETAVGTALVLKEIIDDQHYETWIYCYEGGIYELFTDEDNEFSVDSGLKIMDVKNFSIEKLNSKLYKVRIDSDEGSAESVIALSTEQSQGGSYEK